LELDTNYFDITIGGTYPFHMYSYDPTVDVEKLFANDDICLLLSTALQPSRRQPSHWMAEELQISRLLWFI